MVVEVCSLEYLGNIFMKLFRAGVQVRKLVSHGFEVCEYFFNHTAIPCVGCNNHYRLKLTLPVLCQSNTITNE